MFPSISRLFLRWMGPKSIYYSQTLWWPWPGLPPNCIRLCMQSSKAINWKVDPCFLYYFPDLRVPPLHVPRLRHLLCCVGSDGWEQVPDIPSVGELRSRQSRQSRHCGRRFRCHRHSHLLLLHHCAEYSRSDFTLRQVSERSGIQIPTGLTFGKRFLLHLAP